MSTQAVREYLNLIWEQYQGTSRRALKSELLDEVCRNLGIHRKSAIRMLRKRYSPRMQQGFKGGRALKFSKEAKKHLEQLWRTMGYMAPIRLKAALPEWIQFYEHKDFNESIKQELLRMSESTIKRYLANARAKFARQNNAGTRKSLKKFLTQVPIRGFDKLPSEPGHCEIDCVAHCGGSLSGEFVWTLTLTDIETGWTECEALWGKNGKGVRNALEHMEKRLPFAIKALYSDNGSEFLNSEIINDFTTKGRKNKLPYFRGRPYKKNDQCHVEQKNFTHVRSIFGYGRIDWKKSKDHMNNIYRKEWRELQNFFMPQQKLESKVREGSKVTRKMSLAKTPEIRLLPYLDESGAKEILLQKSSLNPIRLRKSQFSKTRQIFGYYKNSIGKELWGKMAI